MIQGKVMPEFITVEDKTIQVDREGYLEDLKDWSRDVAGCLARQEGLALTEAHWEIIALLRDFHDESGLSPAMRILVRLVRGRLGPEKGNSHYLLRLFPDSPAKLAAKIAGLPRPTNCL